MKTNRLEAFSDGVIAILITIMVLELKAPHAPTVDALGELFPTLCGYVLSFVFLGIYWNNHHHMLQATRRVTGGILWANLHLLFWLSLVPFTTSWMDEHPLTAVPTAAYGVVLFMSGAAYSILQRAILANQGRDSALARALGSDAKGKLSVVAYALAVAAAFVAPWLSYVIYALVAGMWLVPDRRIESRASDLIDRDDETETP